MITLDEESKEFIDIKAAWFKQAKKIKKQEELQTFTDHLLNDYNHDYGTIVHAVAAIALGAGSMGASIAGISGFQASFVMWDFIKQWQYSQNKSGLKILDYDDMLYPQYDRRFANTISKYTWDQLQKEAKDNLLNREHAHPDVIAHWQSIINGEVPFGYKVKEEENEHTD